MHYPEFPSGACIMPLSFQKKHKFTYFYVLQLNDSVKDEITANQRMIPPGKSLMALNGALINIDDVDLYS